MIEGAKKVGLNAKGIKCDFDYIKTNIKNPFIAHVTINNSYEHYIVIYKIKKDNIKVMDPEKGFKIYTKEEFLKIWNGIIIILYPNKSLPIIQKNKTLYSFVFNIVKPFKREIIFMFLISLIITILSITNTYYFKYIIDAINNINNLYIVSSIFLVGILIKIISEYYRMKIIIFLEKKINKKLTLETFDHILSLPYRFYKNKTTGDIVSRINDLNYIKELIAHSSVTLFIDTILIIITSIFLYLINKELFFLSLIIETIYIIVTLMSNKIIFPKLEDNFKIQSEVNSNLIESINSYETIKGINIKEQIYTKFKNTFHNLINSTNKINKISIIEQTLKNLIDYIGNFLILLIGAIFVIEGKITLGELITYNALFMYFTEPVKNIMQIELMIKKSYISLKRLNELYDIDKEILYEKIERKNEFIGNINIENLSYTFDEIKYPLKNLNFSIKPKDKIMLLGKSGSGKSTLVKLIIKHYKCKRNCIYIDGIDINDYNLIDIKENIVYVSQQELLYNDTLFNNIDIYRKNDISEINKICKIVKLDKLISKTSFGLDLLIEENGFNLSGGERQRVVLARTLLSKFKILILDESTNQIDIKLEREILTNIINNFKDKTIIFISHRKNNMDLFETIINIEQLNKRKIKYE